MRDKILSIEDVKAVAEGQRNYFFAPKSLRFFASRVHEACYPVKASGWRSLFFVTSERDGGSPRLFTVRLASLDTDGHLTIITQGEFQQYSSRSGAHNAARRMRDELNELLRQD